MPKTAMVFAAGLGQRMRPLTDTIPKPLIEVAGRPLIDHCLDRFAENGVETAVINVHWLADRQGLARLGLIDFQDAVLGPPAYDVASLLQDARQAVAEDTEQRLLGLYMRRRAQIDSSFDAPAFISAYSVMGAQRATKILGLFTRLDRRDGKPQYLRLLPRIEQTLARNLAHPVLDPLRRWFENLLPRALGLPPED